MDKYLGVFLIAASIVMPVILVGCGTPGEDLLLYWSAMEKL